MSGRRGFILLEAVVALTIVGLTAVGVLAAFGTELRTAERVRRALEADALAADRLARARLLSRDELRPLRDSLRAGRFAPPFDSYTWQLTAASVPGRAALFDVTAVITWDDGRHAVTTRLYR